MGDRNQGLEATVEDGRLVISIGVDLLVHAVTAGEGWEEDWKVPDALIFAADVARYLVDDEEEDGTTRMHRALDAAALEVVEQGETSVRLPDDDEDDDA